jgi:hypothetical protein
VQIKKISNIPVEVPQRQIFSRLQYNRHKTGIDPKQQEFVNRTITNAVSICLPQGRYISVEAKGDPQTKSVLLTNGEVEISFASKSIAELLQESSNAILMVATVGLEIVEKVSSLSKNGDMAEAVIYDAVGSEMAEASVSWLNNFIAQEYRRKGFEMTKRFAPGYGDFPLSFQRDIFNILQIDEMGIKLLDNDFFYPEKTTTAIAGLVPAK